MSETAKLQIVGDPKPVQVPPSSVIEVGAEKIDLLHLRNFLLGLRDNIYCPACRCPNWDTSRDERLLHYVDCDLGKFSEVLLRLFPKEKTSIKWKAE